MTFFSALDSKTHYVHVDAANQECNREIPNNTVHDCVLLILIIYAVASTSSNGLHLLDFFPHHSSPCHVDYDDSKSHRETVKRNQSAFVPLSKRVTSCAIQPLNGTIVTSLLAISQTHLCKKGDSEDQQS
ncbi:hypothetical protein Hanom_Chr14g01314381 [Helianthus anomalus]